MLVQSTAIHPAPLCGVASILCGQCARRHSCSTLQGLGAIDFAGIATDWRVLVAIAGALAVLLVGGGTFQKRRKKAARKKMMLARLKYQQEVAKIKGA
jgi:hypothetical protein